MSQDFQIRRKIIDKLKNNYTFAIVTHKNPDGDAIGSVVAMEQALLFLNKKVDIFMLDKIKYNFLPLMGEERIGKNFIPNYNKYYDVVIMLDVSEPHRTGFNIERMGKSIIVIDHHINKKKYGDIYYCEDVASTTMLIFKILNNFIDITPLIATALYFGIVTDTSGFKNKNTDHKTHYVSGHLIKLGSDLNAIKIMTAPLLITTINLMGKVLKKYQYINNIYCKILFLVVTREDIISSGSNYEEASSLIDYIKDVVDIDVAFLFLEGDNNIYVRCRSGTINVNHIMKQFNGGGHTSAAGASISSLDLYGVIDEIISFSQKYIEQTKRKGANDVKSLENSK